MLTHQFIRDNGGQIYADPEGTQTLSRALDLLMNCELKFGANITVLEPNQVTTVTRVMGCVDTTTWKGDGEEIAILSRLATYYVYVRATLADSHRFSDALVKYVMDVTKGLPLGVVHASGMLLGSKFTHIAVILMIAEEKKLQISPKLPFDDLLVIFHMLFVEGYSVTDVKELMGEELTSATLAEMEA